MTLERDGRCFGCFKNYAYLFNYLYNFKGLRENRYMPHINLLSRKWSLKFFISIFNFWENFRNCQRIW